MKHFHSAALGGLAAGLLGIGACHPDQPVTKQPTSPSAQTQPAATRVAASPADTLHLPGGRVGWLRSITAAAFNQLPVGGLPDLPNDASAEHLPPIGFSHIRTQAAPSLPDDDELADIAPALQALCAQLDPEDWRAAYHTAVTELAGGPDLGSWVGGYAQWLQGAYPTGTFWLQFDSTENFAWGDSGVLYFCVDGHDPATISFQLQSC